LISLRKLFLENALCQLFDFRSAVVPVIFQPFHFRFADVPEHHAMQPVYRHAL
jgi:hypothetical protein